MSDAVPQHVQSIAIVGVGLLGASLGLALKTRGYAERIIGIGRRQATLDKALSRGAIDESATELAACSEADLIVLCTPIRTVIDQLEQLGRLSLGERVVITDVGSTKGTIVAAASRGLRDAGRFVGSHPMAGKEKHGPEAAEAELFRGRPVIITPTHTTAEDARQTVEALWRAVGMTVHHMSPAMHDAQAARISHLPHALAVLLVELAADEGGLDIASTGFADMTRIAAGDPEVWADIFCENSLAVDASIDALIERLRGMQTTLRQLDRENLLRQLTAARKVRIDWTKKKRDGNEVEA